MQQPAANILDSIKGQVKELSLRHQKLLMRNQDLEKQQLLMSQNLSNQESIIEKLNNQLQLLKMSNFANAENENERKELKKTINEYIKEIDNCIQLLNR